MSALLTGRVRRLDPHTVNQIAAGEVVERPASVVKELVENALDAGAHRIEVHLEEAGRALIRIRDDGCGMDGADLIAALERHATSKIEQAEDLERVATLGFRGEALPSIASVSRMRIATAPEPGRRHVLEVEDGEARPAEPDAGPQGTEVTVEDLFYNVPARRKFLRSDTTELGQAVDHVARHAVAHPHVAFRLTHGPQVALDTTGRGDLREAVAGVWSRELAGALAEVEFTAGEVRITGLVSPPHVTKPTRAYQFLYVNGRPVRSRQLQTAVDIAFRELTPDRRHPVLVLDVRLNPALVDVNVSPTKSEVRFQREGLVFDAVRHALKDALMRHGMVPSAAQIAQVNAAVREAQAPSSAPVWPPRWAELPPRADEDAVPTLELSSSDGADATPSLPLSELLEDLRIVGQAMNTFILAETRHGLLVVDQHVAHERILYERLCGIRGRGAVERQALVTPLVLELDRRTSILLRERLDDVRELGFDLEPFGQEGSYLVRAAPAALRGKDPVAVLRDLAEELADAAVQRRLVPTREVLWITTACKMSVKAGDPLSHAEMERLLRELAGCENPYLCPHGRPITVTLGKDALWRMFKRA